MTLGQQLCQLRGRAGLSQDALAERLGVSRQSVSKWETDGSVPELDKLVRLSQVFGVTLDELVKGTADAGADTVSVPEAGSQTESDAKSASPVDAGTPDVFHIPQTGTATQAAGAAEEVLRLHRQKLAGIVLIAVALLATAMNLALVFFTLPVFLSGVLCLVVQWRLGLAIGWTLWIISLFVTRYASAVSMGQLLSPGYWQHTTLAAPLLALVQLAVLVFLAWQTLRSPPGLGACWGIWAGLLAALWLPAVRLLTVPMLQPLSPGEILLNFFPLLSVDYYRNVPLGAVLWWSYVFSTVWLVRRTWRQVKSCRQEDKTAL